MRKMIFLDSEYKCHITKKDVFAVLEKYGYTVEG